MTTSFDKLVVDRGEFGKQTYSGWNHSLYTRVCRSSATHFWKTCKNDLPAFENYLSLLVEGIGRGYVTQMADPAHYEYFIRQHKWKSVLEFWLVLEIPFQISRIPVDIRASTMAKTWNLGENMLRDRPWIEPYIRQQVTKQCPPLHEIERHLSNWLAPLFQAPQPSNWNAPFSVTVVDCRSVHEDFLPGEVKLSGPMVATVIDRRLESTFAGLFLHQPDCVPVLYHSDPGDQSQTALPKVHFEPGRMVLNEIEIALPFLNSVHSHLVCECGVVLVTAVDSQRIWMIRAHD